MRRSVFLSLCVVLVAATGAQAATMFGSGDLADGNFTYTRTPVTLALEGYSAGTYVTLDRIDITYASAPAGAPGAKLQALTGTYTAPTAEIIYGGKDDPTYPVYCLNSYYNSGTNWEAYTSNMVLSMGTDSNPVHGLSYVNFESWSTGATWAYGAPGPWYNELWSEAQWGYDKLGNYVIVGYTPLTAYVGSVSGGWYTDVEDNKLVAGCDLLAQMYVQQGGHVTINGTWDFGGTTLNGSISTVPEPSTLALIGMGLVGLLCYAWRKRG